MKKITLILSITFLMLFFISCHSSKSPNQYSECKLVPATQNLNLYIGNEAININMWKNQNDPTFIFASADHINNQQLKKILSTATNYKKHHDAIDEGLVFYTTETLSDSKTLDVRNILGFSIYYAESNLLEHTFYLKQQDNSYKIIPELNCSAGAISSNDIRNIARTFFSSVNVTALTIIDSVANASGKTKGIGILPYRISHYKKNNIAML